jgi:nitrate reductase NapE component
LLIANNLLRSQTCADREIILFLQLRNENFCLFPFSSFAFITYLSYLYSR